jgi:hypothetical protein
VLAPVANTIGRLILSEIHFFLKKLIFCDRRLVRSLIPVAEKHFCCSANCCFKCFSDTNQKKKFAIKLGVWFMHCHYETHSIWGMDTVFITKNGNSTEAKMLPPPTDKPPCWFYSTIVLFFFVTVSLHWLIYCILIKQIILKYIFVVKIMVEF